MSNKPTLRGDTLTFEFYTDNTILTKNKKSTYLASDLSAAATNMSVQSITGMSGTGQIFLIGEIGAKKTEIVQTSNGTAPSGTTVYFQTACVFDHTQDTKVYLLNWDQYALSRATGISSQKGTIATGALQVDQLETLYRDLNYSTGYSFVEFKNSIFSTFSIPSDPVPYTGYADNTVYMVKKRALDSVNEQIDTDLITNEYLDQCLAEARREYHNAPGKRPYRRKFNADIGNVSTGMNRLALPTDLEKSQTAENLYGVRIGPNENLAYYDKKEFDQDYESAAHTTLLTTYAITHQDLYVDNVRDLTDSGSINLEDDIISYSAKGISGGTLRISTAGAVAHDSGVDIWQGKSFGLPSKFTVFMDTDGTSYVYFNCPLSTAYASQNVWADYYSTKKEINSDSDELDEPDNVQDGFVHFLAWKIKKRKDKGLIALKDDDYMKWEMVKQNAIGNERLSSDIRITPNISHLQLPD
jgi:hypothetical protein